MGFLHSRSLPSEPRVPAQAQGCFFINPTLACEHLGRMRRDRAGAALPERICGACGARKKRAAFSRTQWELANGLRCKECITAAQEHMRQTSQTNAIEQSLRHLEMTPAAALGEYVTRLEALLILARAGAPLPPSQANNGDAVTAVLSDDALAMVLARVPFREPDSLQPAGFYWQPRAHFELRLVCKRFQSVVDSSLYRLQLGRAPAGRVCIRELIQHVQTCVVLGAVVSVRARLHRHNDVSSRLVGSTWCHVVTIGDGTGCCTVPICGPAASRQLREHRCRRLEVHHPEWASCTYKDYKDMANGLYGSSAFLLFDGDGAFAMTDFFPCVLHCSYVPYDPHLHTTRCPHREPFGLQCMRLEVAESTAATMYSEPNGLAWQQEGRALLKDIHALMRGIEGSAAGSDASFAIGELVEVRGLASRSDLNGQVARVVVPGRVSGRYAVCISSTSYERPPIETVKIRAESLERWLQPLYYAGWKEAARVAEEKQLLEDGEDGEGEEFYEQIFDDFGGGDMDDEENTVTYWTEGMAIVRHRDPATGRWVYECVHDW